jgi:MYXO-CTERM domain-containing protein
MRLKTVLCSALIAASASAASADIIDNGQFGANISSVGGATGSDIYGQSFIAPNENLLLRFGMWLSGGGANAPAVRIDLWADDGSNHPDESNVLVSGTVHQGNLASLTRIDTLTNFVLTPGTRYWVVINGLIDQNSAGNYASTWDGGTNTVASGNMDWSNDLGNTWSGGIPNGDFGVYVETAPVPAPAGLALLSLAGLTAVRRRRR